MSHRSSPSPAPAEAPAAAPAARRVTPILLRVVSPFIHPDAARAGDWLVVEPGSAAPVRLVRDLRPNYGALLGHLAAGTVSPHGDPDATVATLRALAAASPPPSPSHRRRHSAERHSA